MSDRSDSWRTCLGCRDVERPGVLLRVVASNGTGVDTDRQICIVVPDPRRRLPGRGGWIHPDLGCLRAAERRRAFGRALRVRSATGGNIAIDIQQVHAYLEDQVRRRPPMSPPDAGTANNGSAGRPS